MKTFLFGFITLIYTSSIYCHPKFISEEITGNRLSVTVELYGQLENLYNKVEFIKNTGQSLEINDFREYLKNSIFVSIPSSQIISINYEIIESEKLEVKYLPQNLFDIVPRSQLDFNEVIELKGIFNYKGSSVVHLAYRDMLFNENKLISKIKLIFELGPQIFKTKNRFQDRLTINPLYVRDRIELKKNDKLKRSRITDNEYLKLLVARDGIYRVYSNDLKQYTSQNVFIDRLKLVQNGANMPFYIYDDGDNIFNNADFIEFVGVRNMGGKHRELSEYGQPYNEYLNRYSDTTVYFLSWNDFYDSLAINSRNLEPDSSADTLTYHYTIAHFERNNWFDFSIDQLDRREMPFWYENKTWIYGSVNVGVRTYSLTLNNIYRDKPFSAYAKVQDWASNITTNAHLLGISVNSDGNVYDTTYIDKYGNFLKY